MSSNLKIDSQKKESDRIAEIHRKTKETKISVKVNLDGSGSSNIDTNNKFLNHMLELFAKHSMIDLEIKAEGDLTHHIAEDIGISLGRVILEALKDKKGIRRYGDKTIPMDETLALCAIDLSGRGYHHLDLKLHKGLIEDLGAENIVHFFESLAINSKMNLHIIIHYGTNEHHKAEAAFKAFAHAFKEAIEIIGDKIPSTKGIL